MESTASIFIFLHTSLSTQHSGSYLHVATYGTVLTTITDLICYILQTTCTQLKISHRILKVLPALGCVRVDHQEGKVKSESGQVI